MGKGEKLEKRGIRLLQNRRLINRKGKSYFLGIGINEYQNFRRLFNAVADVEEIAKVLFEEFEFETPVLLTNREATKKAIINKLAHYYNNLKVGDKLLIYFSGHGLTDGPDPKYPTVFWAPVDADHNDHDSIINGDLVKFYFKRSQAKHIFLISDSCFAGGFLEGRSTPDKKKIDEDWAIKIEEKRSRWALFSGRDTEIVSDGIPGQHSPFARSILDFLQSEEKSTCINVGYFVDQVSKFANGYTGKQTAFGEPIPECGHTRSGQYVFWRRKRKKPWPAKIASKRKRIIEESEPLPSYKVDSSLYSIIPTITIKIITIMEECLRMSCQLLLDKLKIPLHLDRWNIRNVCESKIHVVFDILKEIDGLKNDFDKYELASERVYQATKEIQQQVSSDLAENEFSSLSPIPSDELSFFFFDTLETLQKKSSECLVLTKANFGNRQETRNKFRTSLLDTSLQLQKVFLVLENIIDATERYELPDHLHN